MELLNTTAVISPQGTLAEALFAAVDYPWEVLPKIGQFISDLISKLNKAEFRQLADDVFVHESVSIAATATILGPTIIDAGSEVRPGAYIRGNALIGQNCVIGNSSEIKNAVLLARCQVPHYNYVGDAILGVGAHLGAGTIVSNLKTDKSNVTIHINGERVASGLRKFGAIIGDGGDVGCNAVLSPGSVIGRNSRIYPLSFVRGYIPSDSIYKRLGEIAHIE